MSKVDEELARRLRASERPVDIEELFVGLERRRAHRRRARRIEIGALAVVVLIATAAAAALTNVFGNQTTDVGNSTPLPANGEIVFSKRGDDGRFHIFAAHADGSGARQLTRVATDDTDPAVSPDGRWITFVRTADGPDVVTIPFNDPDAEPVEPRFSSAVPAPQPAWSADGRRIAFREIGDDVPLKENIALLVDPIEGDSYRVYLSGFGGALAHPSWSPASRIVFAIIGPADQRESGWDLATISEDGTDLRPLVTDPGDQTAPAWSPDGLWIAFIQSGDRGDEIWTIRPDGTDTRLIARATDTSLESDLTWVSDGSALLVSDGEWIYGVDATPEGDLSRNLVQIVRGASPAWRPIAAGSEPSMAPSPAPSKTTSPTADSRDIGLGVPICDLRELDGIDWYGEGVSGTAWTGARATPDGRCPDENTGEYIVVADLDGDGRGEPGGLGFLNSCLFCRPYAAADLDGDGVLELVVLEEASSTQSYSFFEVSRPTSERSPGIYNLFVAPPGHPEARVQPGEPLRIDSGGDEGYSSQIRCLWNGPEGRELGWAWSLEPVDSAGKKEVHVLRIQLHEDGLFHVVGVEEYSVPAGASAGLEPPPAPTCGVDWNP
jgi:Tol biopolymer transport system component